MKKLRSLALLTAVIVSCVSCGNHTTLAMAAYPENIASDDSANRMMRRQNELSDEFKTALAGFAYQTTDTLIANSEGNANYSPLSLYLALALAAEGAGTETASELKTLLNAQELDLGDGCAKLIRRLTSVDAFTTFRSANSIWSQKALNAPFITAAAEKYYAEAYTVDFADPETGRQMGEWIKEKVNGTITPDIKPDPKQVMAILNTVYFTSEWTTKFETSKTKQGIFHAPEQDESVRFMNRSTTGGFQRGVHYTLASLSLKGGSMTIILPDEGYNARDLLAEQGLEALLTGGEKKSGEIIWSVPKFTVKSSYQLKETLESLGLTQIFTPDADFTGISGEKPLYVSDIKQETYIAVDEKGLTASAYTNLMYVGAAPPNDIAEMILDRPFIYVVKSDGIILFTGVVESVQS